jgi:hypothetical protein
METKTLPAGVRTCLQTELGRLIPGAVTTTPEQWKGYGLRPLQLVRSPHSPFFSHLEEAVSLNLDFALAEQNPDGSWSPTWSWGDNHPQVWERARQEWSGFLTLETLRQLRRFGRIQPAV